MSASNLSVGRIFVGLLKGLLALFVILVVFIKGLDIYGDMTKRPPGSPPPGYEGRLKYEQKNVPGSSYHKKVPVDLWFGRSDGQYDTTHLRITSDYLSGGRPHYHGEAANIRAIWPSLRSVNEEIKFREKEGLPYQRKRDFTMIFGETGPTRFSFTDKNGTEPVSRCEPMIRDAERGVKYCNENRFDDDPNERQTNYWPLDESIRTPWYKNPPHFNCSVKLDQEGEVRFEACAMFFSYNADVSVGMVFVPESLALDILTGFPRLVEFINAMEVKP